MVKRVCCFNVFCSSEFNRRCCSFISFALYFLKKYTHFDMLWNNIPHRCYADALLLSIEIVEEGICCSAGIVHCRVGGFGAL